MNNGGENTAEKSRRYDEELAAFLFVISFFVFWVFF